MHTLSPKLGKAQLQGLLRPAPVRYLRAPNRNARAKRFNRTLQEHFVDDHEDWRFDDLAVFNQKLADWLLADKTVLPHHRLSRESSGLFLIQHQPKCQKGGPIQQLDKHGRVW